VLPDDDEGTLHARLQTIEHRALPKVVDALGRDGFRVEGRRVVWTDR
jgi:folate-dependent phosphoribosylglycinamide formyltransferase PurN